MLRKLVPYIIFVIIQLLIVAFLPGCTAVDETNNDSDAGKAMEPVVNFSFKDAAVTFPSPVSVQFKPGGRFAHRFEGNSNYLHYLYDNYGQEMVDAFAARNYSPGKLLERMWDGEYAGKWLDADTYGHKYG